MKTFISIGLVVFILFLSNCDKSPFCQGKKTNSVCPANVDPVCGCDGVTYGNECEAKAAGINNYKKGSCSK